MPTIPEATGKRFDVRSYFGLLAPPGTPKPITSKLQAEVARIVSEPDFRHRHLIERGLEPVASTPDDFANLIKKDRVQAGEIVKEAGLEPQ
jgi:tripartite-type tricarboxylate transporter receptor subunit TctC